MDVILLLLQQRQNLIATNTEKDQCGSKHDHSPDPTLITQFSSNYFRYLDLNPSFNPKQYYDTALLIQSIKSSLQSNFYRLSLSSNAQSDEFQFFTPSIKTVKQNSRICFLISQFYLLVLVDLNKTSIVNLQSNMKILR